MFIRAATEFSQMVRLTMREHPLFISVVQSTSDFIPIVKLRSDAKSFHVPIGLSCGHRGCAFLHVLLNCLHFMVTYGIFLFVLTTIML